MRGKRMKYFAGIASVCLLALAGVTSARAQSLNGLITSRTGDQMTVQGSDGSNTTVVLTETTDTRDRKGLFGLEKEHLGPTVLIPGLKVKVEGSQDDKGRLVAKTITVDGDDIETSSMIAAGIHPTAEQVAKNVDAIAANKSTIQANKEVTDAAVATNASGIASNKEKIEQNIKDTQENSQRFAALTDYDVKGETSVSFAVGSSKLDKDDEAKLQQIAQTALGMKGIILQIIGYADSVGSAEANTRLSGDRAKSVVTYLFQQCNIPMRFMVAPGAMGEFQPAASNETKEGRAENRRVTVKILQNKGVAGTGE